MTVQAFNLAEEYRVPVFVMAEGFVGHMRERVVIPDESEIKLVTRKITQGGETSTRRDFLDPDVAPMPIFGRGFKAHVTSSCHDEHGSRNLSDPDVMHRYIMTPSRRSSTSGIGSWSRGRS